MVENCKFGSKFKSPQVKKLHWHLQDNIIYLSVVTHLTIRPETGQKFSKQAD